MEVVEYALMCLVLLGKRLRDAKDWCRKAVDEDVFADTANVVSAAGKVCAVVFVVV